MYCEGNNTAVSDSDEVLSHALVLSRITVLHTGDLQAASINYPQPKSNVQLSYAVKQQISYHSQ